MQYGISHKVIFSMTNKIFINQSKTPTQMTKEQALRKTQDRFTNLLDGKVSSNVSVYTIIKYYEDLLVDEKPTLSTVPSGIEQNFVEEEMYYLTGWDDDDQGGI